MQKQLFLKWWLELAMLSALTIWWREKEWWWQEETWSTEMFLLYSAFLKLRKNGDGADLPSNTG